MPVVRLTEISVRNLKPSPSGKPVIYTDQTLPGFGVRLSGSTATYTLTYGHDRRRESIGRVGVVGLADARSEAKRRLAGLMLGGTRPKRITFLEALDAFVETRKLKNRPSTAHETERLLRVNFRPLHNKQLHDIRAHHISDITDLLSKRGTQSLAAHAHVAASTFLRFCAQRHYIEHNPIADLEKPTLPKSRERVLSDGELRAVWTAAHKQGGHFGDIVKLLILTGQRRGEIASLQAGWLDIENKTCTLPSVITKNKRTHTFPIGSLTVSILRGSLDGRRQFVFQARGEAQTPFNGWSKAKAQFDKKVTSIISEKSEVSTGIPQWTLHDLRRTYATNLQRLGIKLEVIEALLNHVSGTRAEIVGVYQRHQYEAEMREAVDTFEAWFRRDIIGG